MFTIFIEHDKFMTVNTKEEAEQIITAIKDGNVRMNLTYTEIPVETIPDEFLWDVIWAKDTVSAYPYPPRDKPYYPLAGIIRNDLVFYARVFAPTAHEAMVRSKQLYNESKRK